MTSPPTSPEQIAQLGPFELITRADELPVFAFTTRPEVSAYNVFDVSRRLRERGWLVPAYTFPENRQDLSVLRVVVRNGFSSNLASAVPRGPRPAAARTGPPERAPRGLRRGLGLPSLRVASLAGRRTTDRPTLVECAVS